jgi:tyrosyl-tRNA synthetase
MSDFLALLRERDLLADHTDGLAQRLAEGRPVAGYIGFDPTADSLHVGHLTSIRMLLLLARAGGRPIAVVGGATGSVGDPSGRSASRPLLDDAALDANRAAIGAQLSRLLGDAVEMRDNRDWLGEVRLLDFLREVGTHALISEMSARDSVAARAEHGVTFTEFAYSLLQAADFLHLHRAEGVEVQMGGSDQWGNITAGTDLIRRREGAAPSGLPRAFGAVSPLLLTPSGEKMGKTAGGAVFLDPLRTSPFAFFQFWLNTPDASSGTLLRRLTDIGIPEIERLLDAQAASPGARIPQRAIARALTAWVHGEDEADRQERIAAVLFSGADPDPAHLPELASHVGGFTVDDATAASGALAVAEASGLFRSRSEIRSLIKNAGLVVSGERVSDPAQPVAVLSGWVWVRAGRSRFAAGRVGG